MKYYFQNNNAVVENGVLVYIDLAPFVVIPERTKTILGKAKPKNVCAKFSKSGVFYDSLNDNDILNAVALPDKGVEVIGEKAFENCSSLTEINFPEGLLEIKINAFNNCTKLQSIELPHSLKLIEEFAFYGIKDLIINYHGTTAEWNLIKIEDRFAEKDTLVNTLDGSFVI